MMYESYVKETEVNGETQRDFGVMDQADLSWGVT
jgi:hypothetical protein